MFAFSFSPILFFWMMHGTMLGKVAETRRVQSENRLRSRESSKKEHWTRLQKKWMQKHLFYPVILIIKVDKSIWRDWKISNLAKSGVINSGEEIGVRSQRVFKLLRCFSIVQNSFEIFQSWVLVMTTTISINTLGNFQHLLITSIAHEASVFPICIIIEIFASNFIPCHNYCEICL